jgi:hypothetical protein
MHGIRRHLRKGCAVGVAVHGGLPDDLQVV